MLNPRRASFLAVALLFAGAQLSCSSSDGSGSPAGSPSGSQPGDAAPESGQGDSTAPDEGPCEQGALRCLTATEAAICQDGAWTVSQACRSGQLCFDGRCLTPEPCTPKTIDGCFSANAKRRCNEAGSAYEPVKCEAGELCVLGECKVTDCAPGQARCADQKNRQQCTPEGEWGQPQPCGEGHTCTAGRCLSGCRSDPKFTYSSVGCEYWSVDLDQSTKATIMTDHTPPAVAPHSVALSNPGDFPVVVTFSTKATGITLPFGEETIEPGQVREFEMPRMDLEGAGIFDRSVRILSSGPVVATQFNPKDYGNTYSNDSSLLLPADLLGTEYVILGWESQAKLPFEVYPALLGYFTVIAVEEGETSVTVQLSSESNPVIPNGAPLAPGVPHNYKLDQYEVLQIQGISKTLDFENDMSGSFVSADKRIAVFAGHEGPAICPEEARKSLCPVVMPPDEQKDCGCCLEHLEEQLWPLSAWSDEYLVVKAPPRGDVDLDTYRVQAGSDGVKLTTEPAIFGLHGAILAKRGDFIQVATDKSFHIKGSGPIQIAQYLSSMECVSDDTGDPAQIMAVAVSQYRDDYPFLVPAGYNEDWVTIVRPTGSTTDMDGSSVSGTFTPIASTGFEFGYLEVDAGPHRITGSAPFGLTQYGFFEATSYGNPAGLDLGGE